MVTLQVDDTLIPLTSLVEIELNPSPPQAAMSRDAAIIKNRLTRFTVFGIKIHVGIYNGFYEFILKLERYKVIRVFTDKINKTGNLDKYLDSM